MTKFKHKILRQVGRDLNEEIFRAFGIRLDHHLQTKDMDALHRDVGNLLRFFGQLPADEKPSAETFIAYLPLELQTLVWKKMDEALGVGKGG